MILVAGQAAHDHVHTGGSAFVAQGADDQLLHALANVGGDDVFQRRRVGPALPQRDQVGRGPLRVVVGDNDSRDPVQRAGLGENGPQRARQTAGATQGGNDDGDVAHCQTAWA